MFSPLDNSEGFRQNSTMKNEIEFQSKSEQVLLNIGTLFLLALGATNAFAVTTLISKVF